MLQRLKEFAESERFVLPPRLYSRRPIRYLIDLDSNGRLLSDFPIDTSDPGDWEVRRGIQRLAPTVSRSKGITPLLLADNAEYTLGVGREGSNPERVSAMHSSYVQLVERCASRTGLQTVAAVSRFLNGGGANYVSFKDDFNAGASITFRVGKAFPIDSPSVQRFWADVAEASSARRLQCLVCGEIKPVLDLLEKKVKGIPEGHPAGTSMISANTSVFESYGLKKTQNSPTCADCAEKFTEALNHLLSDASSHIQFPSAKVVFWTKDPTRLTWGRLLSSPGQPDVLGQIDMVRSGDHQSDLHDNAFYCTILSANGGRAVVRDWIETAVGDARKNLSNWFSAQAITTRRGGAPEPLGVHALAGAVARDLKNSPVTAVTALVRCALVGTPLPMALLHRAVTQSRMEHRMTRSRAALIKMVLATNNRQAFPEGHMVYLEDSNQEPAYLCGRLLYWIEDAQRAGVPRIKNTIVDRYYGIASTSPLSVFRLLLRKTHTHFTELVGDNRAAHRVIQSRINEIQDRLPEFPRILGLEEQGLFALGYYHQRAYQYRLMDERLNFPEHSLTDSFTAGVV